MRDPEILAAQLCEYLGVEDERERAQLKALLRGGSLPERLDTFLVKRAGEDADSAEIADAVFASIIADIGRRIFKVLLLNGCLPDEPSHWTDLDRNRADLAVAEHLLKFLMYEIARTPLLPQQITKLLGRVANALRDGQYGKRPALFDVVPFPGHPNTLAQEAEASLAFILELLMSSGLAAAEARQWLDAELRREKIVDAGGNSISAKRIGFWRGNFRNRVGAFEAQATFEFYREHYRALLTAPRNDAKVELCKNLALRMLVQLALAHDRTVARPQAARHS